MLIRLCTWTAIVATLATVAWSASGELKIVATVAICAAALVAAVQARAMGRYLWLSSFVAVALLFNPVVDVPMPQTATLVLTMGSLAMLVTWLTVMERAMSNEFALRRPARL